MDFRSNMVLKIGTRERHQCLRSQTKKILTGWVGGEEWTRNLIAESLGSLQEG